MYKNFEELLIDSQGRGRKNVAVVWPDEDHTLKAVLMALKDGVINPIFVGPAENIRSKLQALGCNEDIPIIDSSSPDEAVEQAIKLIRAGKADVLMKGLLDTAVILRAVVNKKTGICARGVLSHMSLVQLPSYHKLIAITDCALLTYPTLEQKKEAILNAVNFLIKIGVEKPKVAVLAAIEKLNPKMPETVEADKLKQMAETGELSGCIVEGPISYDLALKKEAAEIKGFQSPVAGDADLLVVPNITAGNILIKALTFTAGGISAGLILGARVPVVITSRSSSVRSKYNSLRVAVAASFHK